MKRIVYSMIVCCAAMLLFVACNEENNISDSNVATDDNCIVIGFSSGNLPTSRSASLDYEQYISHIDVLIFKENGDQQYYQRVSGINNNTGIGTITLSATKEDFAPDTSYWVYVIANSTAEEDDFKTLSLDELKGMTQIDPNIHMTGPENVDNAPQAFLMDGVASLNDGGTESNTPAAVVLNDSKSTSNTALKVILRRAAAKILVKVNRGEKLMFDNSNDAYEAGYYLQNMPYTTLVLAGETDYSTLQRTPGKSSGNYFKWTSDLVTVTAYAYAFDWADKSLRQEVRLVVNIPLLYSDDPDNPNVKTVHNSYYQIPVSEHKILERNTCYLVEVTANVPGAASESNPVKLTDLNYSVIDMEEVKVDVGGENSRPSYLTLNEYEMAMYDIEDDKTTLEFVSSSEIKACTVTEAYYYNKFGKKTDVETSILNQIKVTPASGLTGGIEVESPLPTNNTLRYIKVKIENNDGIVREFVVKQYPLEYITNVQGYYSYRSDFGGTTYQIRGDNGFVTAASYNGNRGTWTINRSNEGFFRAMYATQKDDGSSTINYYNWGRNGNSSTVQNGGNASGLSNARMYYVRIIKSSGGYTLGKPRITDGKTDPGKDNAELVSPSFMIASQLGSVYSSYLSSTYSSGIAMAASHCEQYVETYKDIYGNVIHLDDWRLPTSAEIEIIRKFQRTTGSAIDVVLGGRYYYSASEIVDLEEGDNQDSRFLRCIRDAYKGDGKTPEPEDWYKDE